MLRTLAIVAGASFLTAVLCFGGAAAISGAALEKSGFDPNTFLETWLGRLDRWGAWEDSDYAQDAGVGGEPTSREIPWSGDNELTFVHGGDVHFHQGPARRVVVTGPARLVERFIMRDGAVGDRRSMRNGSGIRMSRTRAVSIDITAPDVDTFNVIGSRHVMIEDYDQPGLEIVVLGHGDVDVSGAANEVEITILGSGDVDAGRLAPASAHVQILGSGDVTIAPTHSADIDIAGSGDVTLLSDPPRLTTDIAGSGDILHRRPPGPSAPAENVSSSP